MKEMIANSGCLESLLSNIAVAYALVVDHEYERRDIDTALMEEYGVILDSLPQFGGDKPRCTLEIYSWDKDRFLVNSGRGFEIIQRETWT